MNCVNHAEVEANAFCTQCGHALCAECTRNVRGSVFCESCLAELVGKKTTEKAPPIRQKVATGTNPGAAFALGMIPGVGAIYNGEFLKAAIHVLIFSILVQINDNTHGGPGEVLFGLSAFAFYMYMPFEAYFTSKKKKLAAEGIELDTPIDEIHRQIGEIKNKELWGGVVLIVIGGLFLADNFNLIHFERIGQLWPVLLVALGIWLLKRHDEGKAAS